VKVETTEAFDRALRALSLADFDVVASALRKLPNAFGRPHAHSGVRKLRGQMFRKERDRLLLLFLGNHDQIRRFLKNI